VRKTRYVGLAQHKNPHQILRVDDEDTAAPGGDVHHALLQALSQSLAEGAACLTLQDHNKGLFSAGLAQAMISQARQRGCKVVVDPALIKDFGRYRGAGLLAPNRYEAQLATGIEISDEDSLALAARKIAETTNAEFVVITLDRQGSFLFRSQADRGEIIPAEPHEVADGTGAGDAVTATLSVSMSAGCSPAQAVALGNIAGGLEVEHFGVAAITKDQIARELRHIAGVRRPKILTPAELAEKIASVRQAPSKIVFTNGCFDLLHMGHVQYLIQARQCGTHLVVAINSDQSVAKVKGPSRPIVSQDERAGMLAALECVDYVTIFDEETPLALLELLRPDILVKGGSTDVIVGREFVESYGGLVRRLDLVQGRSTTETINKIVETHDADSGGM
jgi:D-beta-D-heptose 7-phosphate kinase/D-beta-D-heptose 1-phosphate adenosyltransferase